MLHRAIYTSRASRYRGDFSTDERSDDRWVALRVPRDVTKNTRDALQTAVDHCRPHMPFFSHWRTLAIYTRCRAQEGSGFYCDDYRLEPNLQNFTCLSCWALFVHSLLSYSGYVLSNLWFNLATRNNSKSVLAKSTLPEQMSIFLKLF